MRRKFYGKPLPAKRDVQAQFKFLAIASKPLEQTEMNTESGPLTKRFVLTEKEIAYLKTVLAHEFKEKNDRALHALSHGSDFMDPDMNALAGIRTKIDDADLSEYVYDGQE